MAELIVPDSSQNGKEFVPETFGRLTTMGPVFWEEYGKQGRQKPRYACICACGTHTVVDVDKLVQGRTRSCGCLRREMQIKRNTTHGRSHSAEFTAWETMKGRCSSPNNQDYPSYGGRGIGYCDRWKKFSNFFEDMGLKPSPAHSIERKDNNGNYEKSNCRWADKQEQANNRRTNRMITIEDKTDTLANWCRHFGIAYSAAHARLRNGWNALLALTTPIKTRST